MRLLPPVCPRVDREAREIRVSWATLLLIPFGMALLPLLGLFMAVLP